MQKVVRSKSYVFEGELPQDILEVLTKWGNAVKKGEVCIYTIDTGEIKARRIVEGPMRTVRRIYITPGCGCVVELDELRDFELGSVSYSVYKKKLCPTHQTPPG
ncbi:MAG: hypothetical protein QXP31_05800 [Pyrobaculum sp.]